MQTLVEPFLLFLFSKNCQTNCLKRLLTPEIRRNLPLLSGANVGVFNGVLAILVRKRTESRIAYTASRDSSDHEAFSNRTAVRTRSTQRAQSSSPMVKSLFRIDYICSRFQVMNSCAIRCNAHATSLIPRDLRWHQGVRVADWKIDWFPDVTERYNARYLLHGTDTCLP